MRASAHTGTRICVVERNPLAREFLVLYFENMGLRALSYATAHEFFTMHENTHLKAPHLVLVDSLLPDLTCPEFVERLHASSELRKCTILLTAADASTAQVQAGLKAGAQDVLEKPLNTMQLSTKITHWMSRLQLSYFFILGLLGSLCVAGSPAAQAQTYRLEQSVQIEQQVDPKLQGRMSQTFFSLHAKRCFFS